MTYRESPIDEKACVNVHTEGEKRKNRLNINQIEK